jgi:hypothetical protein
MLPTRFALGNEFLHPVMFNSFDHATVFARGKTGTFYLYHPDSHENSEDDGREILYAFVGVFSSVEAFIEEADWNQMQQIQEPAGRILGEPNVYAQE